MQVQRHYTFERAQLVRVPDELGIYNVIVSNTLPHPTEAQVTLNFSVVANTKDLNLLVPGVPVMNSARVG